MNCETEAFEIGLPSRPELTAKLLDMGWRFDRVTGWGLSAHAEVDVFDSPHGVDVIITLPDGGFFAFTLPEKFDAFTAAEVRAMENA